MPPTISLIAAVAVAAPLVWAVHLAIDPDPFASAPAAVIAVSLAVASVVIGTGILISRTRWARPATAGLGMAGLAVGIVTPLDGLSVAAIVVSGLAVAGATGPWMTAWLRKLPAAEAPPRVAALAMVAPALVPATVAGFRFEGLSGFDWALIAVAIAATLGISRAWMPGLWVARIGLPLAGIGTGLAAGLPEGPFIVAVSILASVPSWATTTVHSVQPLVPARGSVTIPPELADPGLLAAAGYDDRGRTIGDSP